MSARAREREQERERERESARREAETEREATSALYVRVEHIECHVTKVGHEVDVALPPPAPTVFTERLLLGELEQQMFEVVHCVGVARVTRASALLQVRVVPGKNTTSSLTSQ